VASAGVTARPSRRGVVSETLGIVLLGALLLAGFGAAARLARPALLDFGPNDADYVGAGFRPDWETEGHTRFHWTLRDATVRLPVEARGSDLKLNLRYRRHFVEPAHVSLTVDGRLVGAFEAVWEPAAPYRVVSFRLPLLAGADDFTLSLHAPSESERPLGLALDWLEVARDGPDAGLALDATARWSALVVLGIAYLCVRLGGLGPKASLAWAGLLALTLVVAAIVDVVATERVLREGLVAFTVVGAVAVLLVRWERSRRLLAIEAGSWGGALVALTLVAMGVRLALLLHPRFFYPDVRVHAIFAWQLAHDGLVSFLQNFTANQFRHSLGLQLENGHWYAFPYPPAFYILCWPLLRFLHWRPEIAIATLGAAANSLETLIVFAIARRLVKNASLFASCAAAAAVPVLPIFLARLTLAYFPAIVGQAVDSVVILYLLVFGRELPRPRVVLTLGGLVCLALLTYTQSLLNFGILLPLLLLLQIVFDREPGARRRQLGLFLAGVLGAGLAVVLFYGRYIPVFLDMRQGVPMAEERIVLEKAARARPVAGQEVQRSDDPFAGPDVAPLRGFAKAAWRLRIFYSWAAPLVIVGLLLLIRDTGGLTRRLVIAWALTYLLLNVGSGSLPGPNLVRYNKDHEIVAPLFCVALACVAQWLWSWSRYGRALAALFGVGFWSLGAQRAYVYLTDKFWLER
jgi:hypothetical protein